MGSFQPLELGIGIVLVGTLLEIVQVVAPKDLALHLFDPRLAPISARGGNKPSPLHQ